ncbi:MAG: type I 3-dehydroquinate dehydratase [Planctomycetota bacterium]
MPGKTLIAVPLVEASPPLAEQAASALRAGAQVIELRVDRIGDLGAVEQFLRRERRLPVIATVRAASEGGSWTGPENDRLAFLARLARRRPDYLDVEYATWVSAPPELRTAAAELRGTGGRLILSHHDTVGARADFASLHARIAAAGADVVKIVFTAGDATDGLRLLTGLAQVGAQRPTIALAMGSPGLATRVLAGRFAAHLTFAALSPDAGSAPGQPSLAELRVLYRWDESGPETAVYGVVGWPVGHSLGPQVHNAALRATGQDAVYVPLPVRPDEAGFENFMQVLADHPELGVAGLSITLPHKEHALRWLERAGMPVTDVARRCRAVNTLTRTAAGRWAGDNTDVDGIVAALAGVSALAGSGLGGRRVAVLGAGGAARAAVVALQERGCDVTVYNRTAERAARLAHELRCAFGPWPARGGGWDARGPAALGQSAPAAVGAEIARADILINCTSVGLWPAENDAPVPDDLLRPGAIVFDTVYNPPETRLLRAARARGCTVIPGAAMFIGQAAAQIERWHGVPAPRPIMEAALAAALSH